MSVPSGDCDHRHGWSVSIGAAFPRTRCDLEGAVGTATTGAEPSREGLVFAVSGKSNTGEARLSTDGSAGSLELPCSSMVKARWRDTSDRIGNRKPRATPRAALDATTETVVNVSMWRLPTVAESRLSRCGRIALCLPLKERQ